MKNKIVAISGEPVSGKGTTIKVLVEDLKAQGYIEENIHIISTGHDFRDYFNKIIKFINNINNKEELEKYKEDDQILQITQNPEYRQILEKTILNIQKNNINIDEYKSISNTNNSEIFYEIRGVIDRLIDENTKKLGEEINSKEAPDEIWIFDSRMAFAMIPDAFAVRLTTNSKEAGRRLFNDTTRGAEDKYNSIEEAEMAREERRLGEIERYKKKYGVDLEDENNYNLIIDTSFADVEDVANTIVMCEDYYRHDRRFGKNWASPLMMIPCQTLGETWEPQLWSDWTLQDMEEEIKQKGYYPDKEIDIFKIDGVNYISEGHHRNFACIRVGKTLVPYRDLMKTEEGKDRYNKGNYPSTKKTYLYDHEDLVERALRKNKGDSSIKFSYKDIYPDLLQKIDNRSEGRIEN